MGRTHILMGKPAVWFWSDFEEEEFPGRNSLFPGPKLPDVIQDPPCSQIAMGLRTDPNTHPPYSKAS